jgi:hypothetical protein
VAFTDYARKKNLNMEEICYFTLVLSKFHLVSGVLESFLKPNHSIYYLYILQYVIMYQIWWSEALLWRPPFFFSQPAAGLTNQVPVWNSWASTPLAEIRQLSVDLPKQLIVASHMVSVPYE